ncbi:MAG: hypothetical protein AAF391_08095 [Bacteroidota bacterium]
MKTIVITKKTVDIRPNRTQVYEKGRELKCEDWLADDYINKGLAKEAEPIIKKIDNPKTGDEVDTYYEKKSEEKKED